MRKVRKIFDLLETHQTGGDFVVCFSFLFVCLSFCLFYDALDCIYI